MTAEFQTSPEFELKLDAAPTDAGHFSGYASVFDERDNFDDVVIRGAFTESLKAHRKAGRMPLLLWMHERSEPIGAWRSMREDAKGLRVEGELFVDAIDRAREAHALLKRGGVSGLSIGFNVVESETDRATSLRRLTKIDLMEVSIVSFPALDSARVTAVKSDDLQLREFEKILRDAGLSKNFTKLAARHGFVKAQTLIIRRDAGDDGQDLAVALRRAASILTNTHGVTPHDEPSGSKTGGR